MHFRLVAQLSKRGADLGEVYFEGKAERQVAVLYQNDDYGKDYLKRLKDGLGAKAASMIVAEDAYEVAEPTIDSHAVKMKSLMPTYSLTSPRQSSRRKPSGRRLRSAALELLGPATHSPLPRPVRTPASEGLPFQGR